MNALQLGVVLRRATYSHTKRAFVRFALIAKQTRSERVCMTSANGPRVTLVEAWAHVGKAKSARRNKVLSDMLKLAFVSSVLRRSYPTLNVESHLIFTAMSAADVLNGNGWGHIV